MSRKVQYSFTSPAQDRFVLAEILGVEPDQPNSAIMWSADLRIGLWSADLRIGLLRPFYEQHCRESAFFEDAIQVEYEGAVYLIDRLGNNLLEEANECSN